MPDMIKNVADALDAAARLLDLVTRRGGFQGKNPWSFEEVRELNKALTGSEDGDVLKARPSAFSGEWRR